MVGFKPATENPHGKRIVNFTCLPSPELTGPRLPKLYEVVGGQVVEKPPMGAFESTLASLLPGWMAPFADENHWGLS